MKNFFIKNKAYFYILSGVVLLGTGPLFVKSVDAGGIVIAFYRLLFASVMMAVPALKKKDINAGRGKKPANLIWPVLGGLTFALNIALWSVALKYTTASAVTLLDNTAPVWVGLFSFLVLKEKHGWQYWLGLAATLLGAAVMIGVDLFSGSTEQMTGNLIGIASGISYAAYLLVTQKARSTQNSLRYSWLVSTFGAAALLPVNAAIGGFGNPISLQGYLLIFLMALSSQVIAWLMVNQVMGELPASISSIILVGQPVVTTILGILFLNEVPQAIQLAGGAFCIWGIIMAQRSNIQV
jgi:drug/metabolite transporter (DMT)-like permease